MIGGYAGMAAGASMRGGLLRNRGDSGPRSRVAMKCGAILVEGRTCYLSGEVPLVAAGGIRSGADAVMIGTVALMALGTSPGRCHHCHTGLCAVGITTQEPHLEARLGVPGAAEGVARFLTAMTMEIIPLTKACGKCSVHNLEVEDLRALSIEASAFTGVRLAGIDRPFSW